MQRLANAPLEQMLTLFFAKDGALVGSDLAQSASRAHILIRPLSLLHKARRLNAHTLVLAHNHPGGHACPSQADICSTAIFHRLMDQNGLQLAEHFIIGSEGIFSMRRARLLP
ncbi:JAB domain-containing protein [Novosphingobium sp. THN1]|uniref:JAB domain-containing protein n=1 Tax=Novosphingobium sp. THN1 TaxID=1016987 RepID=UPI0013C2CF9F|nr:JAB domain-containing protein [Novosphingobium sp. THN1]NLR41433.1 JAB domain-containing protein [Novosphingobium sp. ERW19]